MSIRRSRPFAVSVLTLGLGLGLGIGAESANAKPFDAIVPTVYHVNTQNTFGFGSQVSGHIVATTDTLNQTDLDNIVFTAVETDLLVDVSYSGPVNTHILSTINPGELIGKSFAGQTDPMDALVLPGETHLSPAVGYVGFISSYPANHVGTVTVQATIASGVDYINFTYDMVFGDFPSTLTVIAAQRLSSTAGVAQPQNVAMSGEYGESSGRIENFPINPPSVLCTNTQNARCHQSSGNRGAGFQSDALAEPSSGVGVVGAGVVIMSGGLNAGDPFTIPPLVFKQVPTAGNFTPVINNSGLVQLNTTFTAVMPAAARASNPQSGTRVFRANGWNQPGNGQTGRIAANTTPISIATQTDVEVTLKYIAGANAFGGTMANLLDGDGTLFLTGAAVLSSLGNASTRPWIGTSRLSDGVQGNPQTVNGAGWGYTQRFGELPGLVRRNAGIAPPCTQENPPAPSGCGLVTNLGATTVRTVFPATSTKFMYAWTTGTVSVLHTETQSGVRFSEFLTGMGYDTSTGTGTTRVRNIGMVAGSYSRRSDPSGSEPVLQIIGVDMQFTPEPTATAALIGGLGLLGFFARRRA